MNRTITRLFGFCFAYFGFCQNIHAEALPSYCVSTGEDTLSGMHFKTYSCMSGLGGWITNNSEIQPGCAMPTGTGDISVSGHYGYRPFNGCSGGWCKNHTIFCPDETYFKAAGCVDNTATGPFCNYGRGGIQIEAASHRHHFLGCGSGWYQVGGVSVEHSAELSDLMKNCSPCPGLRYNQSGGFDTFPNTTGSATSGNDFYWGSNTYHAMSITDCRAYTSQGIKNPAGTFVISDEGCPYVY